MLQAKRVNQDEETEGHNHLWYAEQWLLKNFHALIPGTCEYVTLHGKNDFEM